MDKHDAGPRQPAPPSDPLYGVTDVPAPDYRAIARQFASLSAAAARHARITGNGDLDQLARRLDDCADAILCDLDRDRSRFGWGVTRRSA